MLQNPDSTSRMEEVPSDFDIAGNQSKKRSMSDSAFSWRQNPYRYLPGSRLEYPEDHVPGKPLSTFQLAQAIESGAPEGIGSFELSILNWLNQFRYLSVDMILQLQDQNNLYQGHPAVNRAELEAILIRMESYDLLNRRIFRLADPENSDAPGMEYLLIVSIGFQGSKMLQNMARVRAQYNPYDVFRDVTNVKMDLSSNQWLLYWLSHYAENIKYNYEIGITINRKGERSSAAFFKSLVTLDGWPVAVHCIRRLEPEASAYELRTTVEKTDRICSLFDHLDELYVEAHPLHFEHRPVLHLLCEDMEHMHQVQKQLQEVLVNHPEQDVWYTTDQFLYNPEFTGRRFYHWCSNSDSFQPVDLRKYWGCDPETQPNPDQF